MTDDRIARDRLETARWWNGTDPPIVDVRDIGALVPGACPDPSVTVITPCHNDGGFLLDALASVRLCAAEDVEMIVVDDHSTDPLTLDVLEAITDAGMTVVASQGHGPAAARNAALHKARGEVVLPLDADNLLRQGFVTAAVDLLNNRNEVAVVHSDAMQFGLARGGWPAPAPPVGDLLCGNQLDMCAVIRRSALESVGGWDETLSCSEDWALWIALLDAGWSLATVPVTGFDYRVRTGSLRSRITPQVHYDQLTYLVGRYPRIYTEHLEAVIANLAGTIVLGHPEVPGIGDVHAEGRAAQDRIAALGDELAAMGAAAALARRMSAESNRAVERATEETEVIRGELESTREKLSARDSELVAAIAALHANETLVAAYEKTRLFRLARRPRALYGRLRQLTGR